MPWNVVQVNHFGVCMCVQILDRTFCTMSSSKPEESSLESNTDRCVEEPHLPPDVDELITLVLRPEASSSASLSVPPAIASPAVLPSKGDEEFSPSKAAISSVIPSKCRDVV